MSHVFGEPASESIYTLMKEYVSLKREETGEKVEAFYAYLEKLLDSEREQIIQADSLKRLCTKLRRECEEVEGYFSVLDELYEIKFKLLAFHLEQDHSVFS